MKYNELINFIEQDLNDDNKWSNAAAYDDGFFKGFEHVKVVFNRHHAEMYRRLLSFCAEHGGIVIKTQPATLETTVRVESDDPVKRSLQQIRKDAGLSVQELAEQSGVNFQMIQKYESGNKDINKAAASTVKALAQALGCSIEDLID
jgi:DNA-binding transcriptional regulator YiaG